MADLVFAVSNAFMANQLSLADMEGTLNTVCGPKTYIIHHHPMMKISPEGFQKNFDILINNPNPSETTEHNDMIGLLQPHQVFHNRRLPKSLCRHLTNEYGRNAFGDLFIPIKLWSTTDTLLAGQAGGFGNDLEGKVVLKDENGTRGMGQVLFDTKDYSPKEILSAFATYYMTVQAAGSAEKLSSEEHIEAIKTIIPKVNIGYDENKGVMETIESLCSSPLYIEEYMTKPKKEYRILMGPESHYTFERTIEEVDGYPQASGSTGGMKEPINPDNWPYEEFSKAAVDMLRDLGFIYGSVDLFIADFGWGIFEYCNQYGANGVDSRYSKAMQTELLTHLADNYLQIRYRGGKK